MRGFSIRGFSYPRFQLSAVPVIRGFSYPRFTAARKKNSEN